MLAILFRPFGFIAPKSLNYLAFQYIGFERHLVKIFPKIKTSCAYNLMPTFFSFFSKYILLNHENQWQNRSILMFYNIKVNFCNILTTDCRLYKLSKTYTTLYLFILSCFDRLIYLLPKTFKLLCFLIFFIYKRTRGRYSKTC